jgi:CRP/FNR family cyclic AMP-dependent transcriptional regulator
MATSERDAESRSLLAGVELFQGVGASELARLEQIGRRRQYPAGDTIVREGKGAIGFFVIVRGQVRVTQSVDGQERELRRLGPGGSFGEMGLFTDRPRSATITAIEPTECLVLQQLDFLDELRKRPEIAIRLLRTLSERLIEAESRR